MANKYSVCHFITLQFIYLFAELLEVHAPGFKPLECTAVAPTPPATVAKCCLNIGSQYYVNYYAGISFFLRVEE